MTKELEFIKKEGLLEKFKEFKEPKIIFSDHTNVNYSAYDLVFKFECGDYSNFLFIQESRSQGDKIQFVNNFIYDCSKAMGIIANQIEMLDDDITTYSVEIFEDGKIDTYYSSNQKNKKMRKAIYTDEDKLQIILDALTSNKNFIEVMKPKEVK